MPDNFQRFLEKFKKIFENRPIRPKNRPIRPKIGLYPIKVILAYLGVVVLVADMIGTKQLLIK